jgi:hypothetical protein
MRFLAKLTILIAVLGLWGSSGFAGENTETIIKKNCSDVHPVTTVNDDEKTAEATPAVSPTPQVTANIAK